MQASPDILEKRLDAEVSDDPPSPEATFARVYSALALLLFGGHVLIRRLVKDPEIADRGTALLIAQVPVIATVRNLLLRRTKAKWPKSRSDGNDRKLTFLDLALSLLAVILGTASVGRIEWLTAGWSGFGVVGAGLALLSAIAMALTVGNVVLSRRVRRTALVAGAGISAWYLPSVIQSFSTVISPADALYSVHEVLLPVSGRNPLGDAAAQYGSLLGWPLLAAPGVAKSHPMELATAYLSFLAVVSIALLVLVSSRGFSRGYRWIGFLVIPMSLVTSNGPNSDLGSIAALFSALPVRTLLPIILGAVICSAGNAVRQSNPTISICIGFLAMLCALNNPDFGLAALLSAGALVLTMSMRMVYSTALFVCGSLASIGCYSLILFSRGTRINFEMATLFLRGFNGGFGNISMPSLGLWLFVFPTFGACIFVGYGSASRRPAISASPEAAIHWSRIVLAVYFGSIGCFTSLYYSGRSVVSGQLQISLVFLGPATLGTLGICWSAANQASVGSRTIPALGLFEPQRVVLAAKRLAICFPLALACGSLVFAPNNTREFRRLRENNTALMSQKLELLTSALRDAPADAVYFGELGNALSLRTGIRNATLTNHPSDLDISDIMISESCSYLRSFRAPIYVDLDAMRFFKYCNIATDTDGSNVIVHAVDLGK